MSADVMPALNGSGHLLAEQYDVANRYTTGELPPCWNCAGPRPRGQHANRDLCSRCYRRWQSNGFAGDRPPDPIGNRGAYVAAERIGWQLVARDAYVLADFAALDNPAIPGRTAELCRRFGVTRRTLTRWRVRIAQDRRRAELRAERLATAARYCGRTRWRRRLRPGAISGREVAQNVPGPVAAMVAAQAHDQGARGAYSSACFRA